MPRSIVCRASIGNIILKSPILHQLGIGPNAILYGAFYCHEKSIILSPIPPKYWESAYKIIVHTHHSPGSLAKVAECIAELKLDTISSWASTESYDGHLCSTSIVVADRKIIEKYGGDKGISEKLKKKIQDKISSLPIFSKLHTVRVTQLSILKAYGKGLKLKNFVKVKVDNYKLNLNVKNEGKSSLWDNLLNSCQINDALAGILTPDPGEAFLRVSLVSSSARLYELSFRLSIRSENEIFAGYWQNALDLIAENDYSVYIAFNHMIEKSENPKSEKAEFHFLVDISQSYDIGMSMGELKQEWQERFQDRFKEFGDTMDDKVEVENLNLIRPYGVGVPCYFASNAKPGNNPYGKAAVQLCGLLEAYGFIPLNIDIASGQNVIITQVRDLIKKCRFMVILHCPDEKNKMISEEYKASEWVMMEEGLMLAKDKEVGIIRLRFNDVKLPSPERGFVDIDILEDSLNEEDLEEFERRVAYWVQIIRDTDSRDFSTFHIPSRFLRTDLIKYYSGKKSKYYRGKRSNS